MAPLGQQGNVFEHFFLGHLPSAPTLGFRLVAETAWLVHGCEPFPAPSGPPDGVCESCGAGYALCPSLFGRTAPPRPQWGSPPRVRARLWRNRGRGPVRSLAGRGLARPEMSFRGLTVLLLPPPPLSNDLSDAIFWMQCWSQKHGKIL